jgi:DNA polymerase III alpha subunit (gram-positive type)
MNTLKSIFNNYDYIICLDTETTGLDPKTCQIIDLGVIYAKKENDSIVIENTINALIKLKDKEQKLSKEIIDLTHITDELLEKEGLSYDEVKNLF